MREGAAEAGAEKKWLDAVAEDVVTVQRVQINLVDERSGRARVRVRVARECGVYGGVCVCGVWRVACGVWRVFTSRREVNCATAHRGGSRVLRFALLATQQLNALLELLNLSAQITDLDLMRRPCRRLALAVCVHHVGLRLLEKADLAVHAEVHPRDGCSRALDLLLRILTKPL